MSKSPIRGCVYYGELPDRGEGIQHGNRPLLVVQNNTGNRYSKIIVVVPVTTKVKKKMPTHFEIKMEKPSTVLCEQITVVPKAHLFDLVYTLTDSEMSELDRALMISLGIKNGGV